MWAYSIYAIPILGWVGLVNNWPGSTFLIDPQYLVRMV